MNPILQQIAPKNNMITGFDNIRRLMNGDPDAVMRQMMRNNPKFREFVNMNRGKSPEQIARENGIDINQIRNMMR